MLRVELLLVLDNCEHVIGSSASLADALLRSAPRLTILATSREPLRVPGEVVFRVPSLAIPDPDAAELPAALLTYEAVRLFVERAGAVAPGFELDESNAAAVARICHRLDGLPLALELAAARMDALAADALAERLDDRFRLLRAGSRTAPTRQQTLEATLDWSYELLSPEVSGSSCAGWPPSPAASPWRRRRRSASGTSSSGAKSRDVLARLVEKSLVIGEDRHGARRYRLLETIRSYAAGRLADARASAMPFRLGKPVAASVRPRARRPQLTGLDPEQGNLRAALETLLDAEPQEALRLSAECGRSGCAGSSCARRGTGSESRSSARRSHSPERIEALLGHAAIEFRSGDAGFGSTKVEEALALARRLGDPALEWRTLHFRGRGRDRATTTGCCRELLRAGARVRP